MRTSHICGAVASRQCCWQSDGNQNEKQSTKKRRGEGLRGLEGEPCRRRVQNKQSRNCWPALQQWGARLLRWVPGHRCHLLPKPLQTEMGSRAPSWDSGLSCERAWFPQRGRHPEHSNAIHPQGMTKRNYQSVVIGDIVFFKFNTMINISGVNTVMLWYLYININIKQNIFWFDIF